MLVNWIVHPIGDGWEDVEPDAVVWLDIGKVEASFRIDRNYYVGPCGAGAGQQTRYDHVGQFIQGGSAVWMPDLSIDEDETVSFGDGRHRFAWVRDHGAQAIPVTTGPETAERLTTLFGTPLTACHVRW